MENGIFEGLKVLDCASFIAAPLFSDRRFDGAADPSRGSDRFRVKRTG